MLATVPGSGTFCDCANSAPCRSSQVTSMKNSTCDSRGSSVGDSTMIRFISFKHAPGQDAVGIGLVDDFVVRPFLDLLADRFGHLFGQAAAIAVRLEHRDVDRLNVGRVQRLGAEAIARAAARPPAAERRSRHDRSPRDAPARACRSRYGVASEFIADPAVDGLRPVAVAGRAGCGGWPGPQRTADLAASAPGRPAPAARRGRRRLRRTAELAGDPLDFVFRIGRFVLDLFHRRLGEVGEPALRILLHDLGVVVACRVIVPSCSDRTGPSA